MDSRSIGTLVMGLGAVILVIGLLLFAGAFRWFGSLPGDFRYETETTRVVIPFTSMLVISGVITLLIYLLRRVF